MTNVLNAIETVEYLIANNASHVVKQVQIHLFHLLIKFIHLLIVNLDLYNHRLQKRNYLSCFKDVRILGKIYTVYYIAINALYVCFFNSLLLLICHRRLINSLRTLWDIFHNIRSGSSTL